MKRNQYTYAVYARATRRRSTVCIRNIPEAYPCVLPSYRFEIGDFEIKDESAERSLGLSGVYLPSRKVQNVPKDETMIHIISLRAKEKRKKFASKGCFSTASPRICRETHIPRLLHPGVTEFIPGSPYYAHPGVRTLETQVFSGSSVL